MNKILPKSTKDDLVELINTRIENLRPKLLDLTRRNPLLSTKFSDRSHSHIRIVHELPQILFARLTEGKMKFVPLPPLEADPKDEQSRKFQNALSDARLTDEIYIKALEAIDQDAEDSAEKLAIAERELKDRIRERLKMPARQTKASLSLVQHARNNNILPAYDLPSPSEESADGRHQDDAIQTLLLPDMLEKRLNSIMNKCNTWAEETGINVLRAAFGFLEWTESASSESALAPLILLPIEIEKKKTREGFEYTVCSLGDTPEINTVLIEKLKREFGIDLPVFNPEELTLENYFTEVGRITLKGMTWRVRRQVAIGVFPSARMAMYHDLDTKSWDFHTHEVISGLLGGKNAGNGSAPFGDEYEIDHPDIEIKVPMIVTDADASQFSVIVDVMDDKNVAVEGPPGSGKSQTIVNTIAVALSHGKKVLFVAEKTAALEVVRSRLEACRLGEFLLTLQATRSSKEKVIESIRERLQIPAEKEPPGLDEKIQQFKTVRTQLNDYIQIISSQFANTDFTVHDVLGYCMHAQKKLSGYAQELSQVHVAGVRSISQENINETVHFCNQLETAWEKANSLKPYWSKIQKPNLDPYSAEEILQIAKECTQSCAESFAEREKLPTIKLNKRIATNDLAKFKAELGLIDAHKNIDIELIKRLLDDNVSQEIEKFFSELEDARKLETTLSNLLTEPMHTETPKNLEQLAKALELMRIDEPSATKAEKVIEELTIQVDEYQQKVATLEEIFKVVNALSEKSVNLIVSFCDVATSVSKSILALRSVRLELPDAKEVIVRASQRASNIEQQRIKLGSHFFINDTLNKEDLRTNASYLEEAGFFYLFSPKFHRAKKFYRSISKAKAFDKLRAVSALREIIHWKENLEAFNTDVVLKEFFGTHFNGCETNFSPFVELSEFYDRIDTKLSGIDNKTLRDFLKREEIDFILSLPKLSPENLLRLENKETIVQLKKKADDLAQKIELFEKLKVTIGRAPNTIKVLQEMNSDKLMTLSRDTVALQGKRKSLNENNRIKKVLGPYFEGASTIKQKAIEESISVLERILNWEDQFQATIISLIEDKRIRDAIEILNHIIDADNIADQSITKLGNIINAEKEQLIGSLDMKELSEFFALASKDKEGLMAYSIVYANKQEIVARGCGDVVDSLMGSKYGLHNLADLTKAVIVQSLIKEVYKDYGSILARYDGNKLNHLRKRLAELDRQIIELSRKRLRVKLRKQANPPEGVGEGRRSEWTEMVLLNNEASKKKRLLPVRDLTKRAGKALLEIKPCWMMSPLAVAQYIEKGSMEFDLVIIDEASQMTPEDAIGALARCKQAMVVGDTNQLPPTPFFKKIIDDIEEEEDESVLEESILEMANAVFRPARRLRWHYRSKHPGLIAFSNRYVYDDDLTIFPCPDINRTDKGVSFHAAKGFYSKGTNPIEAIEIVNAAIKFMHNHKDMSLGIVVINQKQKELVDEQMQYVIAHDPTAQEYIEKWKSPTVRDGLEPFFVKNLENVQGDERDVIFIGTVYGPEKEGAPVMQRFGPINGIAGKRRLNVLFTRAKHRIVTFSSMTANDIRVDKNSNKGVELLQAWLEYCASGKLLARELTEKEPDSPFEEFVISQLKAMGCHPECQVGVAGYFIDIGVKHPAWPHGFIMGVECDGRTYHSSKSARDRDRLREEVLTGLGWYLYRIWSTDWFNDSIYESQKLREIIEKRLKELKQT